MLPASPPQAPILAIHNGTIGLWGLVLIFALIAWWGWHCRRLTANFHRSLDAAGFDLLAEVPELVAQQHPYLIAREGSPPHTPGTFFFFGSKPGSAFTTAQGARIQTLDLFLGFLLPYELPLSESVLEKARQQYRKHLVTATKLEDGAHLFLWARPHTSRHLAVILKNLREIQNATA